MNGVMTPRAGRREWIGLAVLMLPTLLIVMDLSVLHLAVPHLTTDLQPSSTELLWIVDIYGFMIAGSLITMGTLGDRIGRRKLLMIGAAAFGVASIAAAFSTSATMLIITRALLGVAGATLMPSTLSLIRNMFLDPKQRTAAIGVWASGFSVGSAIGPLVGGFLLEHFWWGSVFLLGVPVMVVLLIVGPRILPEYKDPNPGKFDILSAAMSLAAILLVIFGLKQIAEHGFTAVAAVSIVAGLSLGIAFVRRQQILADPLVDLKLFRARAFSTSLITYTFGIFVAFGSFLFVAQYLQLVLGLSPMNAGLWALPGAITSIIASNVAPQITRRVRPGYVVSGGLLLAAIGSFLLTQAGTDSLAIVVLGNAIMSLGFGLTFPLTSDLVVGTAPAEKAGAASALAETGAEFGGALGLAILGTVGMTIYRLQMAAEMPAGIAAEAALAAEETLGGAVAVAADLPADLSAALLNTAHVSFISGLHIVALVGAVGFATLSVVTFLLLRSVVLHPDQNPHGEVSHGGAELVEPDSEPMASAHVVSDTPIPGVVVRKREVDLTPDPSP